ncbi:CPBP family intramembrane metalloprotease [bacterium]|nr:CPBP family intramembrane metalloprotease [bacterium]
MLRSVRESGAATRLTAILLMLAIAAALVLTGSRGGRLPQSDWYEISRQRILQADLMYRMGMYLDLVMPHEELPGVGGPRQLKEKAIADYEREVLVGRPNPVALYRLGVIYGDRGYLEQARQALVRAATLDEEHAGLFFSLAAVYTPGPRPRPLGPQAITRLRHQEQWLAGLALATYYDRLGEAPAAAETRVWAAGLTRQFGNRLVLLLSVYGGLGLIGLIILLVATIRWAFWVRQEPRPARPPLLVPWEPLDALEIVALLYFAMAVTGVLAGLLLARVLPHAPDYVRVAVIAVQYLLATGGAMYVMWARIAGANHRKLSILGLRLRRPAWLAAHGIGGYAVLVVLLVLTTVMLPGGNPLGLVPGQTGERLLSGAHSVPARVGLFVLICVLAPVMEETIFRGFVFPGLRRRMTMSGAVTMSALLFALMHNSLAALVPITLIGIVLAVLYERNLSIVPSIICHALNNTLVFFLMLLTV